MWVTVRAAEALEALTVNLRAPILVHGSRAHQVINEAPAAPVRASPFPTAQPTRP